MELGAWTLELNEGVLFEPSKLVHVQSLHHVHMVSNVPYPDGVCLCPFCCRIAYVTQTQVLHTSCLRELRHGIMTNLYPVVRS